jgi:hypothetical protein
MKPWTVKTPPQQILDEFNEDMKAVESFTTNRVVELYIYVNIYNPSSDHFQFL